MTKILLFLSVFCFAISIKAQMKGNSNYSNHGNVNYNHSVSFPDVNIDIPSPNTGEVYISVKGMANVKADAYVAIFSVSQNGKTAEEATQLMDKRINQILTELKQKKGIEPFVDMISFVPSYEYDVEKKLFSQKTYNEIPNGFELKKNIHIKFTNPDQLTELINTMAVSEVYDLVKVDYFVSNMETIKKELLAKATTHLQEKIKRFEKILNDTFTASEKHFNEDFKIVLPLEMYKTYMAYHSTTLQQKQYKNANQAEKTSTTYYQAIVDKEFDFVINPVVVEPVIQVMYQAKLVVVRDKKVNPKDKKEYFIVTPNGDVKPLLIGNK